jgi:hypothetical protein
LFLALIVFKPELLTEERKLKLLRLWQPYWDPNCHLLSPRNLMILENNSIEKSKSWSKLTEILIMLMENGLLDLENIQQDCFNVLKKQLSSQQRYFVSQLLQNLGPSVKGSRSNGT